MDDPVAVARGQARGFGHDLGRGAGRTMEDLEDPDFGGGRGPMKDVDDGGSVSERVVGLGRLGLHAGPDAFQGQVFDQSQAGQARVAPVEAGIEHRDAHALPLVACQGLEGLEG